MLATHNRRDALTQTLRRLHELELADGSFEIIVVDNASTDGSAEAAQSLAHQVIRRNSNQGSCAKAWGADIARGRFVVFLDDDSHPRFGSVTAMLQHFARDSQLASVGFTVHLPDGRQECSALPGVSVGCGVGIRKDALRAVGGLDRSFFMQAEEYDLAFKLVGAGWRVTVCDDLHVDHLKTATARQSERTTYYDIRNNLRVIARHLPTVAAAAYRADWVQRYAWLARKSDHLSAFRRGRRSGNLSAWVDRLTRPQRRLSPAAFEFFFRWNELELRFRKLRERGCKRVIGLDLGKNVYAFVRAAGLSNIEIACIADDRFTAPRRLYRGIPVVAVESAISTPCDAFVVCNMAAVHAELSYARALTMTNAPIYCWYGTAVPPAGPSDRRAYSAAEATTAPMDAEVSEVVVR